MKTKITVWVVVKVESGIPVQVKAFEDLAKAEKRQATWKRNLRPDYDSVGLFEARFDNATH